MLLTTSLFFPSRTGDRFSNVLETIGVVLELRGKTALWLRMWISGLDSQTWTSSVILDKTLRI